MNTELRGDTDQSLRFLEWLRPGGPWVLTAIPPERGSGRIETATFTDPGAARSWLDERNGKLNCYFMVNPARSPLSSKASKEDVEEFAFLHVDVDPRKGEDLEAERKRILKMVEDFSPSPSAVIDSGGGLQCFWRLDEPLFVGGDLARAAELEAYNRQLEIVLGGDHCHNIDRILRIPGTINVPDKKKREWGRTETLASIVSLSDVRYSLSYFTAAPEDKTSHRKTRSASENRSELRKLADPAELDSWGVAPWVAAVIVHGSDPTEPERWGGDRSAVVFAVTCELVRRRVPPGLVAGILIDPAWGVSAHVLDRSNPVEYAWRQFDRAVEAVEKAEVDPRGRRVLDPSAPLDTATLLRDELFPNSIHTNGDFLEYERGAYRTVEDATMRSAVWAALGAAVIRKVTKGVVTFEPFKPGPGQVSSVLDALKGLAHQPADRMAPPVWLDGKGPPPGEIISCRNGLLHVPTGELLAPTPRFLTRNALDLDFDPDASEPVAWQAFVAAVFPDADATALLQEWFGYYLLPDTSQEKMLLMVGPPRSGKGTIQKVLTELVGRTNVCAPSIKSLGGNFGLQPMIGKQVAFLSDIRIGSGSDRAAITETLLRITGRDDVTADRKNKEAWTGRLAVRFFIATNEMPSLSDNSPALANRFVPLILERSFLGKEDPTLADRLIKELPGILNWSLVGWRRLRDRGHFSLPAASKEAIGEIMELGSPVAAFIRDTCHVAPGHRVEKERLFAAWQRWCEANNLAPGRMEHFARSLRAVTSHQVDSARPSIDGQRTYVFEGISLAPEPPY